ncbi:2-hydroxychromene-2-carboxylate isomerase [Pendulispora albinea]|uniref:2-hydroxychromene-2-carboxylate isomerase n=1 Tax=Pendulispora albinea TaxID=2741071 RepID=A0ABZ2M577_9BACT
MPRSLQFWFDYSCPYAYLGSTQVEALAQRMGAELTYEPMLLGGVFKANGTPQNSMDELSPAKAQHNALDMLRWAKLYDVPLEVPVLHPMRTVEALRATLVTGIDPAVVHGFFRAYWVHGRQVSNPETLRDVLRAAGHDPAAVLARMLEPKVKDDLRARTERAVGRGIFGAPSYVVTDDPLAASGSSSSSQRRERMYWGQDRMDLVEGKGFAPRTYERTAQMAHTLDLYWDFSSPFAYLGSTQADALAARTGATLTWHPMLLGGLFKSIGQADAPIDTFSESKRRHALQDMQRWADYWGVPFNFPTRFPMVTVKALRVYLVLPEARRREFREKTFRAYWAEDRDISSDEVLRDLIGEGAGEVLARISAPEIKQELLSATQRAVDRGVFGAPTWVVDGKDLYWGQDRLPLVERALTA